MNPISRRQFLALSASVTLVACAGEQSTDTDSNTGSVDSSPRPSSDPTTTTGATPATSTTAPATTTSTQPSTTSTTQPSTELAADPFTLGVASGDPEVTSVVLWTRLTGDLPDEIDVEWELLDGDEVVASGIDSATTDNAHTIHALVELDRPLEYHFRAGGWESQRGRTQPAAGRDELRIASAACQHFETGFYAAHRDIAEWQPDLVLFLGDFIYEGAANPIGGEVVRSHDGPEPTDLVAYRARYAHYLGDTDLRASRAACPWMLIWDDHEVENNYAGTTAATSPQDPSQTATFADRRTQAYRAWWEHTPTRLAAPVDGEPYTIYRSVDYGELARISVLDGRQFRSGQECGSPTLSPDPPCEAVFDPARTMLGDEQEAWIAERFASSPATWNVLGQQTVMSDATLPNGAILNYDQWDGYPAARQRLLASPPENLVVITGDIHLAGVASLGGAGAEFVTTAISSTANVPPELDGVVRDLPNIIDAELTYRGYTRHTVNNDRWVAEFRTVDNIADATSPVSTWKSFQVESGIPIAAAI